MVQFWRKFWNSMLRLLNVVDNLTEAAEVVSKSASTAAKQWELELQQELAATAKQQPQQQHLQ